MHSNFARGAAALAMLASTASAHMKIATPVPYGEATLDNSPLVNAGTDFPCKQRTGVYAMPSTGYNQMPVGSSQKLSFIGGATHGGGSCQVSVTMDKEPTTSSEWKVIHSIIGGCPADVDGNLSDNADGTNASVFNFTIPEGMPNGQYTLAWTWFNKIGNREMYMNCAPIEVSGGADNTDALSKFPDMFVANIPNEQCAIPESVNWVFAEPGDSVQTAGQAPFASTFAVSSGCASVTAKGKGAGTLGSPAAATGGSSSGNDSSSAASSAAVTSAASSAAVTSAAATSFATSSAAAPVGTGASAATSAASPAGTSGSCTNGAVACSSEGAVVCMSSTKWGLCNFGCAVPQDVADGMECSNGQMQAVAASTGSQRRSRVVRRHVGHPHAGRYSS